jgi:hypothetical protein
VSIGLGQRVGWVGFAGDQKEGWKCRERHGTGGRCVQKIVHRDGVGLGKAAEGRGCGRGENTAEPRVVGKDGDAGGRLAEIAVQVQEVLEGGDCFGQAGQFGSKGRGKNAAESAGAPRKQGIASHNNVTSARRGAGPEIGVGVCSEIRKGSAPRDHHLTRVGEEGGNATRESGEGGVREIALA